MSTEGRDVLEGRVDKLLERRLELVDVGVKLQEVPVELALLVIEQLVRLLRNSSTIDWKVFIRASIPSTRWPANAAN